MMVVYLWKEVLLQYEKHVGRRMEAFVLCVQKEVSSSGISSPKSSLTQIRRFVGTAHGRPGRTCCRAWIDTALVIVTDQEQPSRGLQRSCVHLPSTRS